MNLRTRAAVHAALGDEARLRMVDALTTGDRTVAELARTSRLPGNAAAHHLDVLERANLITRRTSEGDRRRRYVSLRWEQLHHLGPALVEPPGTVLFVCTHNSARSQFAAALWRTRTGTMSESAGSDPALRVHPQAVRAAAAYGLDLADARPKGFDGVTSQPDLVISVCDRAHESPLPFDAHRLHWSIPDPVLRGTAVAFRSAFASIAERIDRLTDPRAIA